MCHKLVQEHKALKYSSGSVDVIFIDGADTRHDLKVIFKDQGKGLGLDTTAVEWTTPKPIDDELVESIEEMVTEQISENMLMSLPWATRI